jgi:hypothetical protein
MVSSPYQHLQTARGPYQRPKDGRCSICGSVYLKHHLLVPNTGQNKAEIQARREKVFKQEICTVRAALTLER